MAEASGLVDCQGGSDVRSDPLDCRPCGKRAALGLPRWAFLCFCRPPPRNSLTCNALISSQVIRKFNLAYNKRSLDTNMLPGNTILHWKVNQPMGNFQIKQTTDQISDMGAAAASGPNWVDIGDNMIDTERQYHLLYFSTNNASLASNKSPKLTMRVNYTYTSKEK